MIVAPVFERPTEITDSAKIRALADAKFFAVKLRRFAPDAAPDFFAQRIVNHADDDFAAVAQRDRSAEMRQPVKIIHRPVERIDHPLILARLIADQALFAVERVLRMLPQQDFGDEILRQHIDLELDVVRGRGVDRQRFFEMRAQQFTGGAGRLFRDFEVCNHARNLTDAAAQPPSFSRRKKPGEETESFSRVEVNVD